MRFVRECVDLMRRNDVQEREHERCVLESEVREGY